MTNGIKTLPPNPTRTTKPNKKKLETVKLENGLRLFVNSVSGASTSVLLSFREKNGRFKKVLVDAGPKLEPVKAVSNVDEIYITHGHYDHYPGIFQLARIRKLSRKRPLVVYVPSQTLQNFKDLITAMEKIEAGSFEINIKPAIVDKPISICESLNVVPFSTTHRVSSIGYLIRKTEKKRKKKYLSLSGQDFGELLKLNAKNKASFFEYTQSFMCLVSGDTRLPAIRELMNSYPRTNFGVVVLECTFFGLARTDSIKRAEETGHVHFSELLELLKMRPFLDSFSTLILYHVSPRYKPTEVIDACLNKISENLYSRVCLCLNRNYYFQGWNEPVPLSFFQMEQEENLETIMED
eukprot:snap_masked-scaffold_34-processed-gene-3.21-mRNA-1 protein AED:1.00 eAED:1.00 QI:0/-1/0/0/-1/1/1/0/351